MIICLAICCDSQRLSACISWFVALSNSNSEQQSVETPQGVVILCYLLLLIRTLPSGSDYHGRNWARDNKNKFLWQRKSSCLSFLDVHNTHIQLQNVDRSHIHHMSGFYCLSCCPGISLKYKSTLKEKHSKYASGDQTTSGFSIQENICESCVVASDWMWF